MYQVILISMTLIKFPPTHIEVSFHFIIIESSKRITFTKIAIMNTFGFSLRVLVALLSSAQATLSTTDENQFDLNHPESDVSPSITHGKYSKIPIMTYLYPIAFLTLNFFSFS